MARRAMASLKRRLRDESGQALVEAALVLPVVLVVVFGVVMAGRISHAKVAVQATAREASRSLATAPSEQQGLTDARERGEAVAEGYGLAGERLTLEVSSNGFERGGTATAEVSYRVPLGDLPLLKMVDVTVTSTHSERIDLYRSREVASR
ncbi:MAG TPA: TadE/TadG family type IV pilus assembly protein [Dehalococcoidia bacterium]|nr:TadE/TadG family type IV pilus assembly protein [Dehalococcoidia bacterium]